MNLHQVDDDTLQCFDQTGDHEVILDWISRNVSDVQVCDCCGNEEEWYGIPGEHYNAEDPQGMNGPYAYNGGLCECH